jgi:hypothetical protein
LILEFRTKKALEDFVSCFYVVRGLTLITFADSNTNSIFYVKFKTEEANNKADRIEALHRCGKEDWQ